MRHYTILGIMLILVLSACQVTTGTNNQGDTSNTSGNETGRVVRVIDGDTIDVNINGQIYRIRYVGVNTPEHDEPCFDEATEANRRMVEGQTVRLVRDVSNTDIYDRLLRYVYVGDTFVNWELVAQGYAEAVLYRPDKRYYEDFLRLESQASLANLGCHPSGIFNDNSTTR